MAAEQVGAVEVVASINTKKYDDGKKHIERGNNDLEKSSGNTSAFIGKTFVAGFAAATIAATAFLTTSIKGFAEYEQVAGGAAKIFNELDFKDISRDAQNAFKTMNVSATNYLRLINQVGANFASTMGDKKGYEVAKQGLQAISDFATGTGANVDILGDKFQAISRSTATYQSIADQFAGILPPTSKGFLDAAQAAGIVSDSYTELTQVPIQQYQEALSLLLKQGVKDLGLQGNAAAETAKTVSGSFAGMTSSWDNFVSALGTGDTELAATALENLKTTSADFVRNVANAAKNVVSVLGEIINKDPQLKAVVATVAAMAIAFSALAIAMKLAAIAGAVAAFIFSPITLIVGAIIALVGAITFLQVRFQFFTKIIQAVQKELQPFINLLSKALLPAIKQVASFVQTTWSTAFKNVGVLFKQLQTQIAPFMPLIKRVGAVLLISMVAPLVVVAATIGVAIAAILGIITAIAYVANRVGGFVGRILGTFRGLYNSTVSLFRNVGFAVGNVISNAVRGAINAVLRTAANAINGFINNVNGVIGIINKIPGVSLGRIGNVGIPALANGGIISSATLALVGEGSEPEAVIPLSKLDAMLENSGGGGSGGVKVDTIIINRDVDIDLVARKLGIKQLNTNRGVS